MLGPLDYEVANVSTLVDFYKNGYLELLRIIQAKELVGKSATQKKVLMARVDQILQDLDSNTKDWVEKNIPEAYRQGAKDVVTELEAQGAPVKFTAFSQLHQKAVEVIASETYSQFASALKTVKMDVLGTFNEALKQELIQEFAKNTITGGTRKDLIDQIQNIISQRGITSLQDKRGASWQLDRYAEMLARTKTAEATRIGGENRMLENNQDLAQITVHFGTCESCAPAEGKIYSLTGKTPGYPSLDSLQINAPHLFAPNCRHRSVPYIIKYDPMAKDFKELSNSKDAINPKTLTKAGFKPQPAPAVLDKGTAPVNTKAALSKSITLEDKGKTEVFKLNDYEIKFIADKNIKVDVGISKARTSGDYNPHFNTIYVRNISKNEDSQHTFYHELGHAIDFKTLPAQTINGKLQDDRLIHSQDWVKIPIKEKSDIVVDRVIRTMSVSNKEDANSLLYGGSVNGRRMSKRYSKYLRSYEEIIADGYGQYRVNPKEFKKYAPGMYKYFEGLK